MNPPVPAPIVEIATNNPGKELTWTFFAFFARFEYALKRTSRFLAANDAKANWDAFAAVCDAKPDAVAKLAATEAWKFFQANPPRKQINGSAGLGWSSPTVPEMNEPRVRWICRCLRAVRNNLFHGGKYPMMPVLDPTRDFALLAHGTAILTFLADQDDEVRQHLNETYLGG